MPFVFRYFWFIAAAVMLVNIVVWRRRLQLVVNRGRATPAELAQFIKWSCICLVGAPIVLGLVGVVAGWSSPFCAGVMQFTDVYSIVVSLLAIAGWLGLLWWVWRGNGADFLARVGPALTQRPDYDRSYSPTVVRFAVTAMIVASSVGSAVAWRTMPFPPELGCPRPNVNG